MDTPSNEVHTLNTVIVHFINNYLINDIIDCFNGDNNDLQNYIYKHTPDYNGYFRYLEMEPLFNASINPVPYLETALLFMTYSPPITLAKPPLALPRTLAGIPVEVTESILNPV